METQSHRLLLGFNQFFKRFRAEEVTHTAVAKEAGISRQRIVQIYNRYFKRLFENKTREERQRSRIPYRHRIKLFYARRVALKSKYLKPIAEAARKAGRKVELVPMQGTTCQMKITRIRIDGHLCSIHRTSHAMKMSPKSKILHAKISLSTSTLKEVAYAIFHVTVEGWPPHIFVVPTRLVRKKFATACAKKHWHLFIPLCEQPVYKNIVPKIRFFKYENKWPKGANPSRD